MFAYLGTPQSQDSIFGKGWSHELSNESVYTLYPALSVSLTLVTAWTRVQGEPSQHTGQKTEALRHSIESQGSPGQDYTPEPPGTLPHAGPWPQEKPGWVWVQLSQGWLGWTHVCFPAGECSNKECPFLHIDPESKIKDCPWYDRGFCKHGRCQGGWAPC